MLIFIIRIFCILTALSMFSLTWKGYNENKAFRLYSQKAQLTPVDRYTEKITISKPKKDSPFFDNTPKVYKKKSISTYFITSNNERIEVSSDIPPLIVEKMINGEDVVVTYVSNNPKLVRYDDRTINTPGAAITGIVFLLASFFRWRRE